MTFDEAVKSIYARHSAGCCLHVVLDDINTEEDVLRSCVENVVQEGHPDCAMALMALLIMPDEATREMHIALAKGDIT